MHHVGRNIDAFVALPGSKELVAAYFNPNERFAGATFDLLVPNYPFSYEASDALAASLLDVRFIPSAVRRLLSNPKFTALLMQIPVDVSLWEATDEMLDEHSPSQALWEELRRLGEVGPTRASKLMARKRPHLIPVIDSVTRTGLGIGRGNAWLLLREALSEKSRRQRIDDLRPLWLSSEVSTLRILDALMWMWLSRSEHVDAAKTSLQIPTGSPGITPATS